MPDWLCSPHTCFMAGWLYDFQTLVTGLAATAAATGTVLVLRAQIRQASRDATRAIEASRKNLEMQIAHERELREADERAERQRETDHIATVLANERNDLGVAVVGIRVSLDEIEQVYLQKAHDFNAATATMMKDRLERFRVRLSKAEQAVRPLPIRYTDTARTLLTRILVYCALLDGVLDRLALYNENFPNELADARQRYDVVRQTIDEIALDVPA